MDSNERLANLEQAFEDLRNEIYPSSAGGNIESYVKYLRGKQKEYEDVFNGLARILDYDMQRNDENKIVLSSSRTFDGLLSSVEGLETKAQDVKMKVDRTMTIADLANKRGVNLESRLDMCENALTLNTSTPGPSSSMAPPVHSSSHVGSVKWSMKASKLEYQEIRIFVEMFKEYMDVQNLSDKEARFILMQSAEGPVLRFMISIPKSVPTRKVLQRLLERVKPTPTTQWSTLTKTRMRHNEGIQDYLIRFKSVIEGLDSQWLNEEQTFQIFIDSLTKSWNLTAKSLRHTMKGADFEEFTKELSDFDPCTDLMEIDAARATNEHSSNEVHKVQRMQPGNVIENGRVNFDNVTNVGRMMVACREILNKSPREAENMKRFLNQLNSRPHKPQFRQKTRAKINLISKNEDQEFEELISDCVPEEIYDEDEPESSGVHLNCHVNTVKSVNSGKQPPQAFTSKSKRNSAVMNLPVIIQSDDRSCNRSLDGLLDTGADRSIISSSLVKELKLPITPDSSRLAIADGTEVEVKGKTKIHLSVRDFKRHDFQPLECLILDRPGYELLLGMNFFEDNHIVLHPSKRTIHVGSRKVHCKTVNYVDRKKIQHQVISTPRKTVIGNITSPVDNLPMKLGDRVVFPSNRSLYLAPKEAKVMKLPYVLREPHRWRRNCVVSNGMVTQIGAQYPDHCVVLVSNTKDVPLKITPRTVLFDVGISDTNMTHCILTHDDEERIVKAKSFFKRA